MFLSDCKIPFAWLFAAFEMEVWVAVDRSCMVCLKMGDAPGTVGW